MTAFDFTCAHTRHANRSAVHSSAVGWRLRHDLRAVAGRPRLARFDHPIGLLQQHAAEKRPRSPASRPADRFVRRRKSAVTTRMFCFAASIAQRVLVDRRRDHRFDERRREGPGGRRVDRAVDADDAAEGGQRIGIARAHVGVVDRAPVATPHGLVCLITTAAGSVNSSAMRSAASRSSRFVYDSSLPWCTCQARPESGGS